MKLYKYHSFNKNTLAALVKKKIWASKPGQFKDPFDCNAAIFQAATPVFNIKQQRGRGNRRIVQLTEVMGVISEDLNDEQSKRLEGMGVYCLTTDPKSSPMWAHYAGGLRGFCLEYTFSPEQLAEVIEVIYKPKIPELNQTLDADALAKDAAKYKKDDWKYEEEYRRVYEQGDNYYDLPARITSIIFGELMDKEDKNKVNLLLPDPDVKRQIAVANFKTVEIDID